MNKAIPFKTAVGGTCCNDNALFIKSNTMENLKKEVTKINILGAKVKIVRRIKILTENATSLPVCG